MYLILFVCKPHFPYHLPLWNCNRRFQDSHKIVHNILRIWVYRTERRHSYNACCCQQFVAPCRISSRQKFTFILSKNTTVTHPPKKEEWVTCDISTGGVPPWAVHEQLIHDGERFIACLSASKRVRINTWQRTRNCGSRCHRTHSARNTVVMHSS